MKSLIPSAPPERIIEVEGDGLKALHTLRDQYEQIAQEMKNKGNRNYYLCAASDVAELAGDTAVADEPIISEGD